MGGYAIDTSLVVRDAADGWGDLHGPSREGAAGPGGRGRGGARGEGHADVIAAWAGLRRGRPREVWKGF